MNVLKLILPVLFVPMLASCLGDEPNDIAYVTSVGIDKSEAAYLYTIQFAQPTKISGGSGENGGSVGNIVDNIAVEAPTMYSAINVADTIISKDLSLSHTKVFVVSEDIAADGIGALVDMIARNNDIRPDVYISIAKNAGEYLEEVKPSIELNPIKYYQLTYENKNGSAIPQNSAADFYSAFLSGEKDCILPLAGVAETEEEASGEERQSAENKRQSNAAINTGDFDNGTRNYYAGEAGKKIQNKSEVLGAAVFKGDKYIGRLGTTETELHNILMKHFAFMNLCFYVDSEHPITVRVSEKTEPRYDIDMGDKTVDIYPELQCEILSAPIGYRREKSVFETEKDISDMVNHAAGELANRLYREMDADVFGIKGRLKRNFLTQNSYMRYCESFSPRDWSIAVHSDVKIRRMGITDYAE